jgi:hypothetical protein
MISNVAENRDEAREALVLMQLDTSPASETTEINHEQRDSQRHYGQRSLTDPQTFLRLIMKREY